MGSGGTATFGGMPSIMSDKHPIDGEGECHCLVTTPIRGAALHHLVLLRRCGILGLFVVVIRNVVSSSHSKNVGRY